MVARLRIVTDKKASKEVEQEITSGFDKITSMAKKAGLAIGAAFAVDKVVDFGKSLVTAAVEAEKPWNKLANTLENVGVSFEAVEGHLKLAAKAMEETTRYDGEQFAEILDRLVSLTGDFNASMKSVPLVADVAAKFFNNELEPAMDLVGKALTGNTRGLKALGINTKDAAEGLKQLADISKGAAENELNTLDGKIGQVTKAWHSLQEEAGGALLRALTGTNDNISALQRMETTLKRMTRFFSEEGMLEAKLAAKLQLRRFIPDKKLDQQILEIETQLGRLRDARIMENIQAANALKTITPRPRGGAGGPVSNVLPGLTGTARSGPITARLGLAGIPGFQVPGIGPASAIGDTMSSLDREILDRMLSDFQQIQNAGVTAAMGIEDAFHGAFGQLLADFDNLGKAAETFTKGVTGALLGGISQWASAKMSEHAAAAIGAAAYALGFTAVGNFASTSAAWASAAEHTAAIAAYGALAGGTGALQGALSGHSRSRGFPTGSASNVGPTMQNLGPQTLIVHVDGFDPKNLKHVFKLGKGIQEAARIDSKINISPAKRRKS